MADAPRDPRPPTPPSVSATPTPPYTPRIRPSGAPLVVAIDGPAAFIQTNLVGTFTMLAAALDYWRTLEAAEKAAFRFHHISTDEVFGALGDDGFFTEDTP